MWDFSNWSGRTGTESVMSELLRILVILNNSDTALESLIEMKRSKQPEVARTGMNVQLDEHNVIVFADSPSQLGGGGVGGQSHDPSPARCPTVWHAGLTGIAKSGGRQVVFLSSMLMKTM